MLGATLTTRSIYFRCLRAAQPTLQPLHHTQVLLPFSTAAVFSNNSSSASTSNQDAGERPHTGDASSGGAMSQRLAQMTEAAIETGGRRAGRVVQEAGLQLDDELRQKLEDRIAGAQFRQQHASALAQAALPSSAGQGTRDIAGARPWSGNEAVEDTALRMLTDAHKPLRGTAGAAPKLKAPTRVDTGRTKAGQSSGVRLANARDRSSVYNLMKDSSMEEKEKEAYRRELKERFGPGARPVPATISGIASLANERIEDAIARGQFKNLPRGKELKRDYNMSSPFIDTTEYFMNKIIQKQDIVPPWIEKQQELVSTATKFRARLRNDWKRHASRLIASKGGSLEEQLARAVAYGKAEAVSNPPRKRMLLSAVDGTDAHMSQITLAGELKAVSINNDTDGSAQVTSISPNVDAAKGDMTSPSSPAEPLLPPFRDPSWEANEKSFLTLTVNTLNSMTRSYNLMAPDLAKKPYFSLERELRACYADVAPQLADAIRASALAPKPPSFDIQSGLGRRANQLLDRFSGGANVRLRKEDEEERYDGSKPYGFRQFWRDLWAPPR